MFFASFYVSSLQTGADGDVVKFLQQHIILGYHHHKVLLLPRHNLYLIITSNFLSLCPLLTLNDKANKE